MVLEGHKACAFAFGQTGAGKTFSMIGGSNVAVEGAQTNGLVARSLEYLFEKSSKVPYNLQLCLSCVEIYHEQVSLFSSSSIHVFLISLQLLTLPHPRRCMTFFLLKVRTG